MNTNELKKITESLLDTFVKAGQRAIELRNKGLKTILKPDNSPVTNGDLEVDKLLREKIFQITPNIPQISEEKINLGQKKNYKDFWLIDPIDGTKEYIKNKDEFTLNASLIINLNPIIGIIYVPAKKRLFFTYGKGNSFEKNEENKIKLDCKKKTNYGEVHAVHHSSELSPEVLEVHNKFNVKYFSKMSSSYKFCVIASGEFDLYTAKARACEWDIAAGHAIVKNAGGIVSTMDEKEFKYGKNGYKNLSILVKRSNNLDR